MASRCLLIRRARVRVPATPGVACARRQARTLAGQWSPSQEEAVMTMASETPTIVLVHGAWADATGFDPEIRALRDRGFTVIGFANPLRDLAGDAAYLAEFLRTLTGPIVLVGHSYGGNVISAAATGNDQVQ